MRTNENASHMAKESVENRIVRTGAIVCMKRVRKIVRENCWLVRR